MNEDKGVYGGLTLNKKELETRAALQTTREELRRAQISNNRLEIENSQLKELIRAYQHALYEMDKRRDKWANGGIAVNKRRNNE